MWSILLKKTPAHVGRVLEQLNKVREQRVAVIGSDAMIRVQIIS